MENENEKKKKNWSSCSPKRRSHPLTLMNLFLLRGSAENFSLEKLEGKSHFVFVVLSYALWFLSLRA